MYFLCSLPKMPSVSSENMQCIYYAWIWKIKLIAQMLVPMEYKNKMTKAQLPKYFIGFTSVCAAQFCELSVLQTTLRSVTLKMPAGPLPSCITGFLRLFKDMVWVLICTVDTASTNAGSCSGLTMLHETSSHLHYLLPSLVCICI